MAVIELWDEGEVTGDLPVIGNLELLFLQLTELHVLKLELQSKEKLSDIPGQDMAHGQPPQTLQWPPMAERSLSSAEFLTEVLPRSQDNMPSLTQFLIIR